MEPQIELVDCRILTRRLASWDNITWKWNSFICKSIELCIENASSDEHILFKSKYFRIEKE